MFTRQKKCSIISKNVRRDRMPQKKNLKFKSSRSIVKTYNPSNAENNGYEINLITSSKIDTSNSKRLLTPLEAEKRRSQLMTGSSNGHSSVRKLRKPTNKLSLKKAPVVLTAPKNKYEIQKNFIISHVKKHYELIDKNIVIATLLLSIIGIISVFSATRSMNSSRFIIIQTFAAIIGMGIMIFMSFLDYRQLAKNYRLIILLNAGILLFTYLFGEGVTSETNKNWINLGFIKIQPSEFAKILFIYALAVHLYFIKDRINKIFTAFSIALHGILILGLTFLQKDLGSLLVFVFIFVIMSFAANLNIWYYITGTVVVVLTSPFIWSMLNVYQQQRILVPYDKSIDAAGTGIRYQTLQSMSAISRGGVGGAGYTKGVLTQGPLSAKHTDMIYATICEEFGFIGGVAVIILFAFLIYKIVRLAIACDSALGFLICTGVIAMLSIQILENIGMCLGIMPIIGITLPFISYGGSSALSVYIAMGMVLSVSTHKEKTFFK